MSKYYVTFEVYANTTVEVEAGSKEEAEEKACKRVHVSICHHCSQELDIGDIGEIVDVSEVDE